MGMISEILNLVFGSNRNALRETVEVFRENAEAGSARAHGIQTAAMAQFGAEFMAVKKTGFDRFMDGVNRLPRPALALGTIGLMAAAMVDPLWFAARMQGLALVPEPLWWLLGVIVSFYFGARQQMKAQDFQRDLAASLIQAPQVVSNIAALQKIEPDSPGAAETMGVAKLDLATVQPGENPALGEWQAQRKGQGVAAHQPVTG